MYKTELIKYNKFLGVYDIDDPLSVSAIEGAIALKEATNFDITKHFKLRTREGRTLKLSGAYKNLWSNGTVCLTTLNGKLYKITVGTTFTAEMIWNVIFEDQVDYTNIGDLIYVTDNVNTLAYDNGTVRVMRSTSQTYKGSMPGGHLIELFKGRMFLAKEVSGKHLIMQSEGGNYERYDQRDDTSFQTMPEKLTMMKGVDDGLFVSSDKTYFLNGSSLEKMKMTRVCDYKAILGTAKKIKGITVNGEYYSSAVIWESERGICVGGNGGKFINLTEGRATKSSAVSGASYIKLGSINQFVSNTK